MKKHYSAIIDELNLYPVLASYEPTEIGTPPLNIDIETSDIDIACTADNLASFVATVTQAYGRHTQFTTAYFFTRKMPATRCVFEYSDWQVEIFCQTLPICEQWGVRHFRIEERLLEIDDRLRQRVVQLKRSGLKTEAAFARILGLHGDPFEAMLALESFSDKALKNLVSPRLSDSAR